MDLELVPGKTTGDLRGSLSLASRRRVPNTPWEGYSGTTLFLLGEEEVGASSLGLSAGLDVHPLCSAGSSMFNW